MYFDFKAMIPLNALLNICNDEYTSYNDTNFCGWTFKTKLIIVCVYPLKEQLKVKQLGTNRGRLYKALNHFLNHCFVVK